VQVEPRVPLRARLCAGSFVAGSRGETEPDLNREEKAAAVEEIAGQIEAAETIFAIDYRGISVPQAAELRAKLREADASFRVVKNRLTKLAAEKAGREQLSGLLDGPTALTFVRGDMALAAKAITTLDREWEVLDFKGGLVNGDVLEVDEFKAIARLPGRDALNAQFAGVVASPITGLVRGLNQLIAGLASQLQQVADQGLVSGEAPAEEEAPAAEETPAAEEEAPAEETPAEAEPPAEEEAPAEQEAPAEEEAPAAEGETGSTGDAAVETDPDTPGGEAEDVSGSGEETSETSDDNKEEE
jgi:large subunit ribosomal protein L10